MSVFEWLLELTLLGALAATGFYAVRLERALRILRNDRAAVGELVAGFDSSARTAGQGLERLRQAAESAGREIARHVERAAALKDDLGYLTERGNRLADRMDALVRAGRPSQEMGTLPREVTDMFPPEIDRADTATPRKRAVDEAPPLPRAEPPAPLRSQAERDLLKALGVVR